MSRATSDKQTVADQTAEVQAAFLSLPPPPPPGQACEAVLSLEHGG